MPMPKGNFKVYQRDQCGSVQMLGEDQIDHTPKDEKISLVVGRSFDVVAKRKRTNFQRRADGDAESFEVEVRNRADTPETVLVWERHWGDWKVADKNMDFKKLDAQTMEFSLDLKAGESKKVISSPAFVNSSGFVMRSVVSSETWIRPSMSASSSTKTPKSASLTTFTSCCVPICTSGRCRPRVGLELLDTERELLVRRVDAEDHGADLVALLVLARKDGARSSSKRCREMWMRPSMPSSISTKMPKSVIDLTSPLDDRAHRDTSL